MYKNPMRVHGQSFLISRKLLYTTCDVLHEQHLLFDYTWSFYLDLYSLNTNLNFDYFSETDEPQTSEVSVTRSFFRCHAKMFSLQ